MGFHYEEHLREEIERLTAVAKAAIEFRLAERHGPAFRLNECRQRLEEVLKMAGFSLEAS